MVNTFFCISRKELGMPGILYKKSSIESLIKNAQNGNSKALEELLRRIQNQIFAMFYHLVDEKEDVSDLTQEALLKIAKNIGKLNDSSNFKTWVNKLVTNTFYDYLKKNTKTYAEIDEDKLNEIKDSIGCEPGEKCLLNEIETLLKAALMTLPAILRLPLILREYEGLSYNDISKITNTALGTVKSRIARARLKLQQELKDFI